jgi:hypothetical protein
MSATPAIYQQDTWQPLFARLRREAPVHYCAESAYGPYWSTTRYNDIMAVELDHTSYSSELGGIQVEVPRCTLPPRCRADQGAAARPADRGVLHLWFSGQRHGRGRAATTRHEATALVGGITSWHAIGGATVPLDTYLRGRAIKA